MKEQGKNPPDQTNEEEKGSLPEKEFRVMRVKINETKSWFSEKINKIDKPLARLIKKKWERT